MAAVADSIAVAAEQHIVAASAFHPPVVATGFFLPSQQVSDPEEPSAVADPTDYPCSACVLEL